MKYFGVLALAIITTCVVSSYAQNHSVTFGVIEPGDIILCHQYVIKKAKLFQIVSEDVKLPPEGIVGHYMIIGMRATDLYSNGKGGYVTLKNSGPGQTDAIHFESQRGHGYNFFLEIYARYKENIVFKEF